MNQPTSICEIARLRAFLFGCCILQLIQPRKGLEFGRFFPCDKPGHFQPIDCKLGLVFREHHPFLATRKVRVTKARTFHRSTLRIACGGRAAFGVGGATATRFHLIRLGGSFVSLRIHRIASMHPQVLVRLYNFYLKVPGEACLINSALESRKFAHALVRELGGVITDEWIRRLDVCLDLPRYNLRKRLGRPFNRGCYLTTASYVSNYKVPVKQSGFGVASSNIVLRVYDKLMEATKKGGVYLEAMRQRRWNGSIPTCATRVKWQIRRSWFSRWKRDNAESVLVNLGAVVAAVVRTDNRPFFRLTSTKPDRGNKHQSRVETHPEWERVVATMCARAGQPQEPLQRIDRGAADLMRSYGQIRGHITSAAAFKGQYVETFEDGLNVLRELHMQCDGTDESWFEAWEQKAREAGTLDSTTEFPFGAAA